jgi:hypothetical protein
LINFTVRPDNADEYKVKAGARDVLVWEKTGRGKTFKGLMDQLAMVDLYRLAHIASRRLGLFNGDLKAFEETVEVIFEEEEAEPDPTQPAP